MTEQNLTDLLEQTASRIPVGPPPLEELLAVPGHERRRRIAAIASAAAVLAIVVGTASFLGSRPEAESVPAPEPALGPTLTPSSPVASPLVGTWKVAKLVSADGRQLIAPRYDDQVRLTFTRKGELTGRTGCNDVFGSYEQEPGTGELDVPGDDLGTTLVGCANEPPLVQRLTDVKRVVGTGKLRYLLGGQGELIAELRAIVLSGPPGRAGVSGKAYYMAKDLAAREAELLNARLVAATVVELRGRVPQTGKSCTSGRLVGVTLIGTFPQPDASDDMGTIRSVDFTLDAQSGETCATVPWPVIRPPAPGTVPLDLD